MLRSALIMLDQVIADRDLLLLVKNPSHILS